MTTQIHSDFSTSKQREKARSHYRVFNTKKHSKVNNSHFSISDSRRAHSLRSISSIIRFRFSSWETSLRGGRVASQARLARARSIISTSARPAGKPRPGDRQQFSSTILRQSFSFFSSIHPSTHQSSHPSIHPSSYLSLSLSLYLSNHYLMFALCIHLSIYLGMHHPDHDWVLNIKTEAICGCIYLSTSFCVVCATIYVFL